MKRSLSNIVWVAAVCVSLAAPAAAQQAKPPAAPVSASGVPAAGVPVPADYLIGPRDVLSIVFWREKDM
jgi:protein involved in polysaccharide export with SLBB domain